MPIPSPIDRIYHPRKDHIFLFFSFLFLLLFFFFMFIQCPVAEKSDMASLNLNQLLCLTMMAFIPWALKSPKQYIPESGDRNNILHACVNIRIATFTSAPYSQNIFGQ